MAQPFNLGTLATSGAPTPLVAGAAVDSRVQRGIFSVSAHGQLAYQPGNGDETSSLNWFSAAGKLTGSIPGNAVYSYPAISPNGRRVAVSIVSGSSPDVWILDLRRGTQARFTQSQEGSGGLAPVWTPDGRDIIYSEYRTGVGYAVYMKSADDSGPARLLAKGVQYAKSLPASGGILAIEGNQGIWALPLAGGAKPYRVLRCGTECGQPALSPDGKWLAYRSTESGTNQIYITSFPGAGPRWPVSTQGGAWPVWSADGKNLYYEQDFRGIDAVTVAARGRGLTLGAVQKLFSVNLAHVGAPFTTRDGKQFLVVSASADTSVPLTLLTNWPARLRH